MTKEEADRLIAPSTPFGSTPPEELLGATGGYQVVPSDDVLPPKLTMWMDDRNVKRLEDAQTEKDALATKEAQAAKTTQAAKNAQAAREQAFATGPMQSGMKGVTVDKRPVDVTAKATVMRNGKKVEYVMLRDTGADGPAITDARLEELSSETRQFLAATEVRHAELREAQAVADKPDAPSGFAEIKLAGVMNATASDDTFSAFYEDLFRQTKEANGTGDMGRVAELLRMKQEADSNGGTQYQNWVNGFLRKNGTDAAKARYAASSSSEFNMWVSQNKLTATLNASDNTSPMFWRVKHDVPQSTANRMSEYKLGRLQPDELTEQERALDKANGDKGIYNTAMQAGRNDAVVNMFVKGLDESDAGVSQFKQSSGEFLSQIPAEYRSVGQAMLAGAAAPIHKVTDKTARSAAAYEASRLISTTLGTATQGAVADIEQFISGAEADAEALGKGAWFRENKASLKADLVFALTSAVNAGNLTKNPFVSEDGGYLSFDNTIDSVAATQLRTVQEKLDQGVYRGGDESKLVKGMQDLGFLPNDPLTRRKEMRIRTFSQKAQYAMSQEADDELLARLKPFADSVNMVDIAANLPGVPDAQKGLRAEGTKAYRKLLLDESKRQAASGQIQGLTEKGRVDVLNFLDKFDGAAGFENADVVFSAGTQGAEAVVRASKAKEARKSGGAVAAAKVMSQPLSTFTKEADGIRDGMNDFTSRIDLALTSGDKEVTTEVKGYVLDEKQTAKRAQFGQDLRDGPGGVVGPAQLWVSEAISKVTKNMDPGTQLLTAGHRVLASQAKGPVDTSAAETAGIYLMPLARAAGVPTSVIGSDPVAFAKLVFGKREAAEMSGKSYRSTADFLKTMARSEIASGGRTVREITADPGTQENPLPVPADGKYQPGVWYTDGAKLALGDDILKDKAKAGKKVK